MTVGKLNSFPNTKVELTSAVDCEWGDWGSWGTCNDDFCGNGTQTRAREIRQQSRHGGEKCDEAEGEDTQNCYKECPSKRQDDKYNDFVMIIYELLQQ